MTLNSFQKRLLGITVVFVLLSGVLYGLNWLNTKSPFGIYTPGPTINLTSNKKNYAPVDLLSVNIVAETRLQILLNRTNATFLKISPPEPGNLAYLNALYEASFQAALYNAQSVLHLPLTYTPTGVTVITRTASSPLPLGSRIVLQDNTPVFSVHDLLIPSPSHPLPIVYIYNHHRYSQTFSSFQGLGFAPSFRQINPIPSGIVKQKNIGGSSAGLSQALADIEILSHTHQLLPGITAATGTLDEDGSISAIAGLNQKIADAVQGKVTNLFYPSANGPFLGSPLSSGTIHLYQASTFKQVLLKICQISHGSDNFCSVPLPKP